MTKLGAFWAKTKSRTPVLFPRSSIKLHLGQSIRPTFCFISKLHPNQGTNSAGIEPLISKSRREAMVAVLKECEKVSSTAVREAIPAESKRKTGLRLRPKERRCQFFLGAEKLSVFELASSE